MLSSVSSLVAFTPFVLFVCLFVCLFVYLSAKGFMINLQVDFGFQILVDSGLIELHILHSMIQIYKIKKIKLIISKSNSNNNN